MDRAKQMMEYDQVLGEKPLFHGTRTNKPEAIFKGDASFDMRYCHSGLWGRGNYFAVNAHTAITTLILKLAQWSASDAGGLRLDRSALPLFILIHYNSQHLSDDSDHQVRVDSNEMMGREVTKLDVGMTVFAGTTNEWSKAARFT